MQGFEFTVQCNLEGDHKESIEIVFLIIWGENIFSCQPKCVSNNSFQCRYRHYCISWASVQPYALSLFGGH